MSNKLENSVCDKHKSKKKGVCNHCRVCRYCDAPSVCILKKHMGYQNKIIYQFNHKFS